MAKSSEIKRGDHVSVPWGLGTMEGIVLDIYGPMNHRSAMVQLLFEQASGAELDRVSLSFPVTALTLIRRDRNRSA